MRSRSFALACGPPKDVSRCASPTATITIAATATPAAIIRMTRINSTCRMVSNVRSFADLVTTLESRFGDHPVRRLLDFRIIELEEGRCVMALDFKPEFDNTTGAVHGGILAMLADTAIACALATVFDGDMNFATSNLNIHFLRRANTAITATATIIKKGSRICVGSCDIHDGETRLVATSICDFVLMGERAGIAGIAGIASSE